MKISNSRYILTVQQGISSFNKENYAKAVKSLLALQKANTAKDGRVSEETQMKMMNARRLIKHDSSRMYRVQVTFNRYRAQISFDIEVVPSGKSLHKQLHSKINAELQRWRIRNRDITSTKQYFGDEKYQCDIIGNHYQTGGWVHSKPNQIYKIYLQRKVRDLYKPKQPIKKVRYIGVELEFCSPVEELDLALMLHTAGVHKFAQMKKDGSLRPKMNERGFELALLLPERYYKKDLRTVCRILEKVGARADERRCGLHIHLDMRTRRKKDIVYNNLVACQNVLASFLDPSRRDNEFCRIVESRKFPTKFNNTREERYKTINAASYYKYQTLEVRMHQGSVNFRDIANWMNLLIKIGNYKTRIKKDINELTDLRKHVKIDNRMRSFFQDKVCFWQLQGPQNRTVPTFRATGDVLRDAAVMNNVFSNPFLTVTRETQSEPDSVEEELGEE